MVTERSAQGVLYLERDTLKRLGEKRNAHALGMGGGVVADPNIGAIPFNPALFGPFAYGIALQQNVYSLGDQIAVYQNVTAVNTKFGNFAYGVSAWDRAPDYFRLANFYDFFFAFSSEIHRGIYGGASLSADPFQRRASLGLYAPFTPNIGTSSAWGLYTLNYGISLRGISLSNALADVSKPALANGVTADIYKSRYIRLQTAIEIGFSTDFLDRTSHAGMRWMFFDLFHLSAGTAGQEILKFDTFSWGAGFRASRAYTAFGVTYAQEFVGTNRNHALSLDYVLRLDGVLTSSVIGDVAPRTISPANSDGFQDITIISLRELREISVKDWKLLIVNEDGETIKIIDSNNESYKSQKLQVPRKLTYNGTDFLNRFVSDGTYKLRFVYISHKFDVYYVDLPDLIVDNTSPQLFLTTEGEEFVIRNASEEPDYVVSIKTSESSSQDQFAIRLVDESNQVVRLWKARRDDIGSKFIWNARDNYGKMVAPGKYSLLFSLTDEAGNNSGEIPILVSLKYGITPVSLEMPKTVFSPRISKVLFYPSVEDTKDIVKWELLVSDSSNKTVWIDHGSATSFPGEIAWNGLVNGRVMPDGAYIAQFYATNSLGKTATSGPVVFEIDTQPPEIEVSSAPDRFSPDGDGLDDFLVFSINLQEKNSIREWALEINEPGWPVAKTFKAFGKPPGILRWNGVLDSGELVKSLADYEVTLTAWDSAGNKTTKRLQNIKIDFLIFRLGDFLRVDSLGIIFSAGETGMNRAFIAKLDLVGDLLTFRLKNFRLLVEGHADLVGSDELNFRLAEQRAVMVRNYLIKKFPVLADRITTASLGKSRPVTTDLNPEKQRLNRRVELVFSKIEVEAIGANE